jgi:lipoate---protein ligase
MLRVIETCLPRPEDDIASDGALFHALETTGIGETLRFWERQRPAVIVGRSGVIPLEAREGPCAADGVPIVRRQTGGGAVVVGRGCLNYSLGLSLDARPELRDVTRSYQLIFGRIIAAIGLRGLAVRGVSDLALDEWKVSGNAQRRGRRALLHHGTLLYDFDVRLIERYLKEPQRQPAYRAGRRHAAFVANVPLAPEAIKVRMAEAWSVPAV